MLQKIFLTCLIWQVVFPTTEIKEINSKLKVYQEKTQNTTYTQYTGQQLTLTFDEYPLVFSQHFYKLDNQIQSKLDDNLLEIQSSQAEGCFSLQSELKIVNLQTQGTPSSQKVFNTDMIAVPKKLRAYIARNDLSIIEIDIESTQTDKILLLPYYSIIYLDQYMDLNFFVQYGDIGSPKLLYDEKTDSIYVITEIGALSFSAKYGINDTKFEQQTAFIQRQNIYKIHFDSNRRYVYVVSGAEGVDVYQIYQGKLNFRVTIIDQVRPNFKIVDVATSGKLLFVLDESYGFYTVDVSDIKNYFQPGFKIEIGHGRSFDFHQNTFIFIATSIHKQDYAIEVFVDFQSNSYYVNRVYFDGIQLYGVEVFKFYAILIGKDSHKIIYHSIFNGFQDSFMKNYIFSQPDLMKVVQFDLNDQNKNHQILGLGKSQLLTFQVQYAHPRVKCRSTKPIYEVSFNSFDIFLKTYLLKMNSTNCNTKQGNRDLSQYSQCQIDHQFNFITKQVFILFQKYFKPFLLGIYKLQIIVGVFVITLLILILTWCLYACRRKWGRVLDLLDRQVVQLKSLKEDGEQHNLLEESVKLDSYGQIQNDIELVQI